MTKTDKINDIELIQKFIEEYNRKIDWNNELRQEFGLSGRSFRQCTMEILDAYIDTEYITAEKYDIENARIYADDEKPDKYEFQAYSHEHYCTSYFWVNFNETKEEYKADRIRAIQKEIEYQRNWRQSKFDELGSDLDALNNLDDIMDCNK